MGGKLWASRAGREGRHNAPHGRGSQGQRIGATWPGRSHQAALLHTADPLHVPSSPPKPSRGSHCGEAGADMQAGIASSAIYLQFRWDPLQSKRLDKEAPSTAQPHPNGIMSHGSRAPQAHCYAAILPTGRGQLSDGSPTSQMYQGLEKGSVVPSSPEHLPRERQSVPPSCCCSPRPQLAHGPGEGGKGEGRTNPNQLKTEPGTRRLRSTNQLVALWICGQRVGFRFSNIREEPVTMPWRWSRGTERRGRAGVRETDMAAEGKGGAAWPEKLSTNSMLQGPQPHASNTTSR